MNDKPVKSLLEWMEEKGYSIRGLAKESNVAKSSIENILRGYRFDSPKRPVDIQPETRRKIAKELGVEIIQIKEFVEIIERRIKKENRLTQLSSNPI